MPMPTNLVVNDELMKEAMKAGGLRTKQATVRQALKEFVIRHKQAQIMDLFGQVDYEAGHDYKKQRRAE